ncbi:MAG: hypothetical protein JRF64_06220, partial [Deltaproteobacteria bacterium]|nr:hypothetical protein [Deltaproteobacteria bacterium]
TEKLKKGLKILGANEASTLPYLLELFSVKDNDIIKNRMSPEVKKARIIEAVKGITLRGAEMRPLVMAIEDLHWVDKSSEDYWKNLLDSISGARIFLLFTYRPDFVHTWGGRTYHNQVNLNRFSNQESLLMVSHLLRTDDLDRGLEELILEKTEGVPFFIEEFVKSLKDLKAIKREENKYLLAKDIHDLTIPSTVQDMIMARVDSLPEDAKELLQTGSVIEREFFYELIKLISGLPEKELLSRLSMLKDSELLYERGIYPESTYIFKHALTRVVVYDSLLRRRKKMLHRLIGRAIEKLNADRLAEQYEVLAKHFVQGDEWAKALEYLCKAAEKATQTFANREAVSLYDHALEAARHIADAVDVQTLMAIYKAKADLYFTLSDFENSRAEGKRLLSLAHRVGDKEQESVALATMGKASLRAHDFEKALAYSDQAIEVAGAAGAKPALAAAQYTIGVAHAVRGHSDMARERIDKSLTISRSEGDVNDHVLSLYSLGLLKNWEGEYEEALHYVSEGLQIGSKHNLSVPLLQCIWAKGLALTGKGDFDDARLSLEEGLAFSEKLGDEVWGHRILNSLGWLYRECEDLDSSLELNLRAAAGTRERGDAETIANSELNLGEIFLAKGDLKVAKDFFDRVYNIVRDPNTSEMMLWRYSNRLYANLGEFWLAREDTVKAWEFAEQALEIARRTNSKKNLAKGWRLEAEIALFNKQWDKAESALKRALTMAQSIGNPTQLWKTYLTMGRLHTEVKRLDMAFQAYQAARTIIEQIQRNLRDPGLRSSLVNSPLIKKIYDLSDLD